MPRPIECPWCHALQFGAMICTQCGRPIPHAPGGAESAAFNSPVARRSYGRESDSAIVGQMAYRANAEKRLKRLVSDNGCCVVLADSDSRVGISFSGSGKCESSASPFPDRRHAQRHPGVTGSFFSDESVSAFVGQTAYREFCKRLELKPTSDNVSSVGLADSDSPAPTPLDRLPCSTKSAAERQS